MQLGTLGAGNHYAEIQVVSEIYDVWAARKMGIEEKVWFVHVFSCWSSVELICAIYLSYNYLKFYFVCCIGQGQVCVMIHSGSRGFGHQVATDALLSMEKAMKRDNIETNDRQLACARIRSQVWKLNTY